jgi:hypothetical protein
VRLALREDNDRPYLQRVPILAADVPDAARRRLDPCSAFLLANVDGVLTIEGLVDLWGGSRFDAVRAVFGLIAEGILRF